MNNHHSPDTAHAATQSKAAAPARGVDTFVDEAQGFIRRNKLEGQQASFGGLVWGALRAVLECDYCPGTFRVPFDENKTQIKSASSKAEWRYLVCPKCKRVWEKASPGAATGGTK